MSQQLMRSESDRKIAGVCGGLAEYLNIDSTLVRLGFVVLSLASGIGLVLYLLLWLVMPSDAQGVEASIIIDGERQIEDPKSLKMQGASGATVGVMMILVGGFFLLSQIGWLSGAFWPLILVGAGIWLVVRRGR